jgi:hypothetical protein
MDVGRPRSINGSGPAELEYDLGTWQGQIAATRAGALPDRFYKLSPEDLERGLRERKAQQCNDAKSDRFRSPARRIVGFDKETRGFAVQTRRRGGEWSEPEVIQPEVIEAEGRRNPRFHETERLVRAALTGLRQARLRAVPGGPKKRKSGHRAAFLRDGGESPGRVEVLVVTVVRRLLPLDGASHRGEVSNGAGKLAPPVKASTEPGTAPRRRRGGKRYAGEVVAAVIRAAIDLKEPPSRAVRERWHRETLPDATTTLTGHILNLMGGKPLPSARRKRWEREAGRMTRDDSVTLNELTRRLG